MRDAASRAGSALRANKLRAVFVVVVVAVAVVWGGRRWLPTTPLPSGSAPFVVKLRLTGLTAWIEGSKWYLTVSADAGGSESQNSSGLNMWSKRVAPGRYTVESHQRQCSGNCGDLMSASSRCKRTFTVPTAGITVVVHLNEQTESCTIAVQARHPA